MQGTTAKLLVRRQFLPLFITQALAAWTDNFFKSALVLLATFQAGTTAGNEGKLVAVAGGLFILPFFLFSATAGRLADRFDKSRLIVATKVLEIGIVAIAFLGFARGSVPLLLVTLFLMGVHSTFFGPLKYGILPEHLRHDELLAGNALVDAGTFLAILLGMLGAGLVMPLAGGAVAAGAILILVAAMGLVASLFIPRTPAAAPGLKLGLNIVADTAEMLRYAASRRDLFLAILGISWFYLVGATFVTEFPAYVKQTLGGDEHIVTLFTAVFSIGVGIGSLLANKLLKGEISARHVPFAALGISLFIGDFGLASPGLGASHGALVTLGAWLARPWNWRMLFDVLGMSVCGGIFIVPLYALLQERSESAHRARVIAANNAINALFMVISAGATVMLIAAGLSIADVFLVVGAGNLAVAIYICGLLPQETIKTALAAVLRSFYGAEIKGLENYTAVEGPAVVIVNHVSVLDAALLLALLPGQPVFAVDTFIARRWWLRPFLRVFEALPVDPANPMAIRALTRAAASGRRCVIFPEGRITVTGALMKVHEGPGLIADRAHARIIPVRIDGAQYTPFSHLRGKVRLRWFPRIRLTVLPASDLRLHPGLQGRERRRAAAQAIQRQMIRLIFETANCERTFFQALLDARDVHGSGHLVIDDIERKPVSLRRLIAGSFILGRHLAAMSHPGERVGVLLPNSAAAALTFFGLQAYGRVPALLNFTTGTKGMLAAVTAAELGTIITSRRFVDTARLAEPVRELGLRTRLVWLEDLRIGRLARLAGLVKATLARAVHRRTSRARPNDPAVVLFTSGTEGLPKGVVLSHRNILANQAQLATVVDFNAADVVFNALPLFHSFGLTGGFLLPVLSGVKTFLYPTPLHYRIVPELVYDTNATIFFGTNTFLAGYARMAHAYDFYSVRYVFAGAEPVKEETRRIWAEKFGLRLLEGYGATETAPVIATNTAMMYRAGTVGTLLPGIEHRLEPVEGLARGGRLHVKGPNVMLGYLRAEAPGVLQPPADGWYDSGDIVEMDRDGFMTMLGRARRFAKIAGEMVPLGAVEDFVGRVWPGSAHAVVTRPDASRGETLVLVTEREGAERGALLAAARREGLAELFVPRVILTVKKLPLLGTGKTDYTATRELVEAADGS